MKLRTERKKETRFEIRFLSTPSSASGSQEIEDFLGVSLQSETTRGPFRSASLPSRGLIFGLESC